MTDAVKSPTEIDSLLPPDSASSTGDHQPKLHIAAFPGERSRRNSNSSSSRPVSASERTPLLQPYAHSITASRQEDSPVHEEPTPRVSPTWFLETSFFSAAFLGYVNWALFTLTALSTVHSTVAAVLLPHRSSTFLPLWLSFLGGSTAILHLLDFAYPKRTPVLTARALNIAVAVLLFIDLLLLSIVRELRIKESYLTITIVSVAFVTYLVACLRPILSDNPPPFFSFASVEHKHDAPQGGWGKFKHGVKTALSLLTITFPLFLIHLLIFLCSLSIMLNLCLRAVDASLVPPGRLHWVNPTQWQFKTQGMVEGVHPSSRFAFRLHLYCTGGDDWEGRTILYEGPASRPGSLGAKWLEDFATHKTNSTIRLCVYDRPGYGFSDNAATASLEFVSRALEEALDKSGEYARVSKPGGGFVVVGEGYGGLLSRVFASRNSQHIHSLLFLDPQTELSYFSRLPPSIRRTFKFFLGDVVGSLLTPLGLRRFTAAIFQQHSSFGNRESRVLGTARDGLSATFGRSALQQTHEAHSDSQSWRSLRHSLNRFPAENPSILISSGKRLQSRGQWKEGHEDLADHVLGKGLIRWERLTVAGHDVCGDTKEGPGVCSKALEDLLAARQP